MSHTIRATAVDDAGATDETIAPKGAADDIPGALGQRAGRAGSRERTVAQVEAADERLRTSSTASPARSSSRSPCRRRRRVRASRASSSSPATRRGWTGFSPIRRLRRRRALARRPARRARSISTAKAADELRVEAGRPRPRLRGRRSRARCACATSSGSTAPATADASLLMSLEQAQQLYGHAGEIRAVLVSNRGGDVAGAALSDEVVALLQPVARRWTSRSRRSRRTRSRTRMRPETRS